MKNILKTLAGIFALLLIISSCKKTTYSMDEITAPTDISLTATVVGQDATHPTGDSSGKVIINIVSKDGVAYSVDYDASDPESFQNLQSGSVTHQYTDNGLHTYTITAKVTGQGGINTITSTVTVNVYFKFVPDAAIVTALTGDDSKTWRVDSSTAAHFGVGPYNSGSIRPEWYAAAPNEKTACCLCFYTAKYTFAKVSATQFTLSTSTPNGAFTKTGSLAGGLPGIPASGPEACYTYGNASSTFVWVPASSGAPATGTGSNSNSTQTSILLNGNSTFIGYGAVLKEYEILTFTDSTMSLRVQGTETGNAWYLKLKKVP